MIGLHALTGIDFLSAFFGKQKKKCYKNLEENSGVQKALATLSDMWQLFGNTLLLSSLYFNLVVHLKKVGPVRYERFYKKIKSQSKIVDTLT